MTADVVWPDVLGPLMRRDDLPAGLVEQAMTTILSGDASDAQIAAFAVALRSKTLGQHVGVPDFTQRVGNPSQLGSRPAHPLRVE